MTTPYLPIQTGSNESIRGRALISIETTRSPQKFIHSSIDINGHLLKEDLVDELLYGKLISLDIFTPSYVRTQFLNKKLPLNQLRNFAKKESRDLVVVYFDDIKNSSAEVVNKQMNSRYVRYYYEDVYMRILESMANQIFHNQRRYPYSQYYIALFKISQLICLLFRSIKENDGAKQFYQNKIVKYQESLPFLDLTYLVNILDSHKIQEAQKAIEGIDVLYVALKKHYSCPYSKETFFEVNKDTNEWLEKGLANLYYRFFKCLFQEDYKQAGILQQELKESIENDSEVKMYPNC